MKNEIEIYLDELTGLKNRRFLFEKGDEILNEWGKGSFIIFDLDNFKQINDKFGHLAGDEVLRGVAKCLYSAFEGEEKELIRYAGDEFVIITKENNKDILSKKSQKLLDLIKTFPYRIPVSSEGIYVGASIGIAIFPEEGKNVYELFEKADSALYFGKRKGKFQFRFYSEVEDEIKKEKFLKEKSTPDEIIDREKEIAEITNFLHNPSEPFHIKGEHGTGKTRLLSFFVNELIKEGKKFIKISFKEDLKDVPFSSFCEHFGKKFDEIPFILKEKMDKKEIDFIVIDDIDYIDKHSEEFLKSMSEEFPSIISAGTCDSKWKGKTIELLPLNKELTEIYVRKLIPDTEIPEKFLNWVYEISGGIPYIIEECLRYAVSKDWITIEKGKFKFSEFPEEKPSNINEIYLDKIKSLDKELKNFIVSLSVLGKSFKIDVASRYVGINPGRFIDLADKAVNLHILEPYGREGYSFINENFRRFIYEKLSDDSRRKLHTRITQIASRLKDIPEEVLTGTLAFHSKLAGKTKEAMEASLKLSNLAKHLEERADIKRLLEKRKILKRKEIPYTPPPQEKDFPLITDSITSFFGALESFRIYPENSKIVHDNIERFKENINKLLKERKSLTLSVHENNLIVDGVQFPNQRLHAVRRLVELINEFEVQSISFIYEVNEQEVKNLLSTFSKRPSDVKKSGGIENLKEVEALENIVINQKVYIALGDELEALKKIPEDTSERLKEILDVIKTMPEKSDEWIGRLKDIIKDLKSEDLKELFYNLPENEKVLKELSKLESKEAIKIRETLEEELEKAEKSEKIEEAIKIRKILKYLPEREKLIEEEKNKLINYEREEFLKEETQRILTEIFDKLSEKERKTILKKITQNLSDGSSLIRKKTIHLMKKFFENNQDFLFMTSIQYMKKEENKDILTEYFELFSDYIKEKINKGYFEEVQDFAELILKLENEDIGKEFLDTISDKYVELKRADRRDDLIRIRVLFRILEPISIPYLFEKVEREPLLSDLVKEMLRERIKTGEEFVNSELKKEAPVRTLEIFLDTIIEEKININKEILERFLNHRDEIIRIKALEALIINEPAEGERILIEKIAKGDNKEKIFAIRLAGKYRIDSSIPELMKFVEKKGKFSPEPELSLVKEAINSLAVFNEKFEVGNIFVEALKPEGPFSAKKSKPPEVKTMILRALRNFEPFPEWMEVIEKLTNESNIAVKSTARLLLQEWKKKL